MVFIKSFLVKWLVPLVLLVSLNQGSFYKGIGWRGV
jgi:hypothetical protein